MLTLGCTLRSRNGDVISGSEDDEEKGMTWSSGGEEIPQYVLGNLSVLYS